MLFSNTYQAFDAVASSAVKQKCQAGF